MYKKISGSSPEIFNWASFCTSLPQANNEEKFFFEVRTSPVEVGDTE